MKNLRELPKFRDGLSYLYIEHGRIEQRHKAIAWYGEEGEVAIPCAALGVLLLGPGTSITHAAVKALAENGCSICWVGEEGVRFYASGTGETRSSRNLLKQVEAWSNPERHMRIVEEMYRMRFPQSLPQDLTLQQIRGMEGVRVRDTYARASRATGVPWTGRSYKRGTWRSATPVNRALSAGSACLYGICHAGIVSAGYNPALGFIHTGKQLSFVYDMADLYKTQLVVAAAFEVVADSDQGVERQMRERLREASRRIRLLERIVDDLAYLFTPSTDGDPYADDGSLPGRLWDPIAEVPGGIAYGCDGSGERTHESEGGADAVDD